MFGTTHNYASKAWLGRGGALCVNGNLLECDVPKLQPHQAMWYTSEYILGESVNYEVARAIAKALGLDWVDAPVITRDSLVEKYRDY